MGWTSFSDFINETTQGGKYLLTPFSKVTVNGIASVARYWHEFYTSTGTPGAGPLTGDAGSGTQMKQSAQNAGLYIGPNVTPDTRHLLTLQAMTPTTTLTPGLLYLVDFLVYWPSLVVTGTPTVLTNPGLPRYTDGKGIIPIVAVQSALGAALPALTLNCRYNDDTDGDLTATLVSPVVSAPVSTLFLASGQPFGPLPTGKKGVKIINSYTIATPTTGTVAFMLIKILGQIPLVAVSVAGERDFMNQIPGAPKIYDDALLGFIGMCGGAMIVGATFIGLVGMGWG